MYAAIDALPDDLRPIRIPVPPYSERDAGSGRHVTVSRGQSLFYAEDPADAFFELVSGTIRCCRLMPDGRRQVFRFAGPGDLLGVSAEATYGFNAEAVGAVTVRRRPLSHLDLAMETDAPLRRRVVQSLRDELSATRTQMMLLGRLNATERVASFLLNLAENGADEGGCIDLPMTRTDIADYLGLALETVSRKFGELASQGVIELATPQRVRITDMERMEALSDAA